MSELDQLYHAAEPRWRRLEGEAKFILEEACRTANIKIHSLVSRTKSIESIRDKAARKDISKPLDDLEDIVGVRIVCLLRSDIKRIDQIIREQFTIVSEDNKVDGAPVEAFGYQSVHFIVQLSKSCSGPRYQALHNVNFEIQVRTLAMDAWAALSHYLDYKSESDVPKELKKDFFALSGLFFVADTHFELFYGERLKSQASANESVTNTPHLNQELNLDTLTAFLKNRYPARRRFRPSGVSELVAELVEAGYTNLDKLRHALDASEEAFQIYEKTHQKPGKKKINFYDIGVVRLSVAIFDKKYSAKHYANDRGFNEARKHLKRLAE